MQSQTLTEKQANNGGVAMVGKLANGGDEGGIARPDDLAVGVGAQVEHAGNHAGAAENDGEKEREGTGGVVGVGVHSKLVDEKRHPGNVVLIRVDTC